MNCLLLPIGLSAILALGLLVGRTTGLTSNDKTAAQKWILVRRFEEELKNSDLELQEEILPALKDGDVLFEAMSLSVDPYMRPFSGEVGEVMVGEQIARVKDSKHKDYKHGALYKSNFGWRTHTIVNMDSKEVPTVTPVTIIEGLPPSLALGILGMPGVTAYVGLLDVMAVKEGDVVLVNAAAGAVGSVVGQIAKRKGCTVIGSVGSEKKVAWLKELGFDHVFNYKKCELTDAIKKAAPDGVDVFFDLVGGDYTSVVINDHMRQNGRVLLVGDMSVYNSCQVPQEPLPLNVIRGKRLRVQGTVVYDYPQEEWQKAINELKSWIQQGKLKYKEHVTPGFANMRDAFYGLFRGENIGKAIVNV